MSMIAAWCKSASTSIAGVDSIKQIDDQMGEGTVAIPASVTPAAGAATSGARRTGGGAGELLLPRLEFSNSNRLQLSPLLLLMLI